MLGAKFALMQQAPNCGARASGSAVGLSGHSGVHASAVILATGASYRRLGVPELEEMNGAASSTAGQPPRLRDGRP